MKAILLKEINDFLHSLIGYLVMAIFVIGVGLVMWVLPDNVLDYGYATLDPLFSLGPYLLMFLVPAITMRMFSEERKNGTIELLRSLPFQAWEIVLGKFLGGFFLVVITLLLTGFYFLTIYLLGNPVGNLDVAGSIGSYIGLFMLGALFTAIGLFASSVSQNQIVSFLLAAVSSFFMFEGFEMLASANPWSTGSLFLEQLGIVEHYYSLSRGLIDLADMVYFVGMTALFILITKYIIEVER